MLSPVAAVSTPGLVAGVVSLLQDELLALELRVLIAHPAREGERGGERRRREGGGRRGGERNR